MSWSIYNFDFVFYFPESPICIYFSFSGVCRTEALLYYPAPIDCLAFKLVCQEGPQCQCHFAGLGWWSDTAVGKWCYGGGLWWVKPAQKYYGHFQGENLPLFVGLIQCGVNLGSLSLNKYTWLWPTWVAVSLREPLMKTLKINGRRQTFFAGYIACKGDWPWLRKAYGLVTGFTSKRICHLCDSHEPKMHVSECP